MANITDLDYTFNAAANKKPFLTDIVETLDSIETYINDKIKDNLIQLTADAFPSGYAYTNDAVAKFSTYNLFDKQTEEDSYTGGDYTIATTGAWTDVDATNASITLTPEYLAGDFKVTFQFNVSSVTSNATNETDLRLRLTDGTETSTAVANVKLVTGVTSTTNIIPVTLVHDFDAWSVAAKTVKLQYYIATSTATTIKILANSTHPLAMRAEKI